MPRSYPHLDAGPAVRLPKKWVPCPLCSKHYVLEGRASKVLCNFIQDD